MSFEEFLKTVPTLKLVELQHMAREFNDADTLRDVLRELRRRAREKQKP